MRSTPKSRWRCGRRPFGRWLWRVRQWFVGRAGPWWSVLERLRAGLPGLRKDPERGRAPRVQPELLQFEERYFPGQTPGALIWLLAGSGWALVDQVLVLSPVEAGPAAGGRDRNGTRPLGSGSEGAEHPAGWLVEADDLPVAGLRVAAGLLAGDSSEAAATEAGNRAWVGWTGFIPGTAPQTETAVGGSAVADDPLGNPLAGPLDGDGLEGGEPGRAGSAGLFPPAFPAGSGFWGDGGGGSGGSAPGGVNLSGAGTAGPLGPVDHMPTEAELTAMLPAGLGRGTAQPLPQPAPAAPVVQPPASNIAPVGSTGNAGNAGGNQGGNTPPPPPSGGVDEVTPPPHLPLAFEANLGQNDNRVQIQVRGNNYNLFLTATEMVLALNKPRAPVPAVGRQHTPPPPLEKYVVRVQFVGANPSARLAGVGLPTRMSNYLRGNSPNQWVRNIPTYGQVSYQGMYYPGI